MGRWEGGLFAFILLFLLLVYHRWPVEWMPSLLLGLYTLSAAEGLLAGGSPFLLLLGVIAALAAWDLNYSISSLAGNAKTAFGRDQQNKRLVLLAWVVGVSVLLIGLGLLIQVSLPFGVVILLAFTALGSLSLLVNLFKKIPRT